MVYSTWDVFIVSIGPALKNYSSNISGPRFSLNRVRNGGGQFSVFAGFSRNFSLCGMFDKSMIPRDPFDDFVRIFKGKKIYFN